MDEQKNEYIHLCFLEVIHALLKKSSLREASCGE